ncbi:MAG: hypothetical protein PHI68_04930, partial [Candidatus Cloacimonetes bacterium]|nr:hypothetical protein [Candidatus Cloacimonadota bacterium]
MKTCIAMMAALFVFSSLIYAVEFHSTTNGGDWMDVNTWQNPGTPGQDDDVFIHGTVDVNTSVFCNNLSVIGNESMLRGGLNSYCSINVGGNINSSGWITSSNYTFTVNLYGNLNVSYNFVPTYFNWLGSGNRTLSCGASYQGIKTRSTTTISATIDTIFALSDVYIAPGGTYTPQLSGNDHQVVLYLIDRETRTSFNLYSRSTKLKDLLIVGDGSSIFNFNNDSGLSEPTLQNCEMNNLTLTGIHNLYAGCTLRNVTNNGLIYNSSFSSCNLNHYGLLINNGQIGQAPHGYGLSIYSYGDIINAGLFNPSYLYLRGENPRVLQSTQSNPIKASGSISGISGLGDVYCGEQLYFANVSSFNGPVNLKAYTQSGQAKSIGFTNVKIYNSTITGIASSAMEGTDLWISNTPVSNLILQGSIYFTGNSTAYNITNHGTIQNGSTETGNLSIHGDFVNYGTIQSYPQSYNLIVYADANVLNYGTWTAYSLNLNGTEPQNICFGVNHPFAGSLFTDTNSQSPIHVVEEDLYIQASQMDLNNAPLYLNPGGFDLNLTGTSLYETEIISSLENNLNMSGNARISSVTLNSITNLGTMELISNTNLNGDLVNHGTIQNNNSSYHLNISGNLTNHGTIRSYGGYDLYVYLAGNASNYGVWNNYLLNLNGSQSQQIIFPSGHAFSGTSFVDSNETSSVTAIGDIYFQNCSLNFNSASLLLAEGADMILDNCNLYYAAVLSDLSSRLSMVNGGFVNYCSFQSITFAGLISLSSNTTIADTLVNTGIIQNQNSSNYLHVYGDLDNQGIIQNHPDGYYLYLYCYSNLVNSGTISCYRLNFSGTDAQTLSNTGFISVSLLYDTVSASSLELLSDLYLTNTILNLGGSVLILSGDTREGKILSLSGGYLSNASITGGNSSKLVMSNLANISNVSFDDIIWEGTIILNSTITVNNLINNATIMNYQNSSVSLDVYGRFDNSSTGILTNNTYYNFTLNAYGDVYNHGQLRNYEINFRSSENQFIYHSPEADTIRCSHFRKSNATGSLTMLSDLVLKACIVKFNHQDLIMEQGGTAYALNLYGA